MAARLGEVVAPDQFDRILPAVERALGMPSAALAAFRDQCVACRGWSGEAIVDWTLDVLRRHDAREDERTTDAPRQDGTPGGQPGTMPGTTSGAACPGQASA